MGFLRIGSGGGLAIGLIFNVIALSTPGWIYTNTYSVGLFALKTGDVTTDVIKGDAEKVCIAFNVMGDVILLCGAIAALIAGGKEGKEVIGKVGGVLSILAGIFIMIGMATYTGLKSGVVSIPSVDWGYSFAFGWVSFCLAIIGGIVAFVGK
ncbi:uncharacterized protein LOC120340315 [Styela clava]|uniref:uncharacterized protein LOC120340315 n=1 Tax=Styela clava TaxID=7725 RepID=UPI0019392EDC|nr:uncharacterized protein LOC120340315 [Styela clava]